MGDDVQWKKAEKPQIIQNVLGHPQLRPLIDDWERREPDPRIRSSLNDKLARLSPDRPFWVAALLFDLYQNPETLPSYCKTSAVHRSEEEASNEIFQEALPHYFRLQKVLAVSNTPKVEKQANLAIRMIASLLSEVQLVSVYLALRMQKLEWPEPLDDEEKQPEIMYSLHKQGPCTVYSGDLEPVDGDKQLEIKNATIPIVKLTETQAILVYAKAKIGTADVHSKWQTVVAPRFYEARTMTVTEGKDSAKILELVGKSKFKKSGKKYKIEDPLEVEKAMKKIEKLWIEGDESDCVELSINEGLPTNFSTGSSY